MLLFIFVPCFAGGPEASPVAEGVTKALKKKLGNAYRVEGFLGKGGESDVFLVKDQAGQLLAAKRWKRDQIPVYMRGLHPFEGSIVIYKTLQDAPYMNHLVGVAGDDIMLLSYVEGEDLKDALPLMQDASAVRSIIDQVVDALRDMDKRGIIARDVSAENIRLSWEGKEPRVIFLDPGAYVTVEGLIKANKDHPKDFGFFDDDVLWPLMKNKPGWDAANRVYRFEDGRTYVLSPPLVFYNILSERINLLSLLLTKLFLIKNNDNRPFKVEVKERIQSLGDQEDFLVHLVTPEIAREAAQLLEGAREGGIAYTRKDFEADWRRVQVTLDFLYKQALMCVEDTKACLKKSFGG